MSGQVITKTIKFIAIDILWDVLFFPIWWYTLGLRKTIWRLAANIKQKEKEQALFIWVKSLFKPMYGQHDWQGKLISFFFRFLLLFWKLGVMTLWVGFYLFQLFLWLVVPPVTIYQIWLNLF